jgi:hypothetical protein
MSTCAVCCDRLSTVSCHNCEYMACKQCVSTYLLSVHIPNCMNCRSVWNSNHLVSSLGRNFVSTKLKVHIADGFEKEEKLKFKYYNGVSKRVSSERAVEECITKVRSEINEQTRNLTHLKIKLQRLINIDHTCGELLYNCPRIGCSGFIDKSFNCSSCTCSVCKSCMEERGNLHTCDPNIIKSIDVINKTSKPCPSCHLLITRAEGCDQMWCTSCHKTFSWKTNKLICPAIIHNPHYIEFKNTTCSFEWHDFVRVCKDQHFVIPAKVEHYFMATRSLKQIYTTKIEQLRQRLEDVGVEYILKEITHTVWKRRMYNFKMREQSVRIVFQHVSRLISYIYQLIHSIRLPSDKEDPLGGLENARVEFNGVMQELSSDSKFKPHVLYIDSTISITHDC